MSLRQVHYCYIMCDRCGAQHGAPTSDAPTTARSAMEARAAAFNDGWRFPPTITTSGNPGSATSDACPECAKDWTPLPRHRTKMKETP